MTNSTVNRQVILVSYPNGMPEVTNFSLREMPIPKPKEGEVLIRANYLSVDPYMRARMSDLQSYMAPFKINEPPVGGVVGTVVESKSPKFKAGDTVRGILDWADFSISSGVDVEKIDPNLAPLSTYLDVLGMTGMTAYFGLQEIGQPKGGETVVISGAAGAVGSIVGQIAKIKGCQAVGIVGSQPKIAFLTKELKFDAAVSYKEGHLADELKKACPRGIDIYFDNVGGEISDVVYRFLNPHARIVLCGQISTYNKEGPDMGLRPFFTLLVKVAKLQGLSVRDYIDQFPEATKQMAEWIKQGKIKYRETIVKGLENTPKAFIDLFKGENIGKELVEI